MYPYLRSFGLAVNIAWRDLRRFDLGLTGRLQYCLKAGNLAVCFLGFSVQSGEASYRKSAELGALASLFDLTSDGLGYSSRAVGAFQTAVDAIVDREAQTEIMAVLETKRQKAFRVEGLERGTSALRFIIKYFGVEHHWRSGREIAEVGILLQIVDDILDMDRDLQIGELNFLTSAAAPSHLSALLNWNYREKLSYAPHSFFLIKVIDGASCKARRLMHGFGAPSSRKPVRGRTLEATK